MKMRLVDITSYPKFAKYVQYELPACAGEAKVRSAMHRYGQMSTVAFTKALAWGSGPELWVRKVDPPTEGNIAMGNTQGNIISVHPEVVTGYETNLGLRLTALGLVSLVEITLLHELAHWGDNKAKKPNPADVGNHFEAAVYGRVIPFHELHLRS